MADGKWKKQKEELLRKLNWKLPAKKNEYTCGKIFRELTRKNSESYTWINHEDQ